MRSLLSVLLLSGFACAVSTFSPARPPAIPLAVKSPYLNTYLHAGSAQGGNGGYLAGEWPMFWSQSNKVTGWTGLIKVDGSNFVWMGAPGGYSQFVDQTNFEYTSSRSTFTMSVGGMVQMRIEFMSPIYPNDLKRQSLEFSYMTVSVSSLDGAQHSVQVYTDVSGEWASNDYSKNLQWDYVNSDVAYHKFYILDPEIFSAGDTEQAEWGNWYYAAQTGNSLTYVQDGDNAARNAFAQNGRLPNTQNNNFRPINNNYPVFAYAVDFESVNGNQKSHTWSIGLAQDQVVQFDNGQSGLQPQPALWKSYFSNEADTVSFFINDFSTASSDMTSLDNMIASDSTAAGGQDYLTITSLAIREAFGALQLANTEQDPYLWLKEISSDGNMQSVDVIFPLSPVLFYLNPELMNYMLKPLFQYQESGQWTGDFCIHDIGFHYPNATGHHLGDFFLENLPLEESGNIIIMSLAYAQRTGDNGFLQQHYDILRKWNQYLVDNTRVPADQMSTDDFAGSLANQTDLALKGIIGIKAMAQIADLTSHSGDAANFNSIAQSYLNDWMNTLGGVNFDANPPHSTLAYGMPDSHGLLYNLYADRLLSLDFVPQKIYDIQSNFYPTVQGTYGVPLDTRHSYTKLDWECWVASLTSDGTKSQFYNKLATWIDETSSGYAMTDLYDVNTGDLVVNGFIARPVVGGVFAELALP